MNKFSKLVITLSVFILLSTALLFGSLSNNKIFSSFSSALGNFLSPIQSVLSIPTTFLSSQKDSLSDMLSAYEENAELKRAILNLESISEDNSQLRKENESLRKDLQVVAAFPEKSFISSFVLVRTPVSWTKQLIVDAGTDAGVAEQMLVMANGGLIGIVTKAEAGSSTVKLLSNSDEFTKIPVKLTTDTGDVYGILSGYDTDSNSFIVNQLNATSEIAVGSKVVTSDLAGTTPSNILVGKVSAVKSTSNNLNRELFVEPAADFSTIYTVLLVRN